MQLEDGAWISFLYDNGRLCQSALQQVRTLITRNGGVAGGRGGSFAESGEMINLDARLVVVYLEKASRIMNRLQKLKNVKVHSGYTSRW